MVIGDLPAAIKQARGTGGNGKLRQLASKQRPRICGSRRWETWPWLLLVLLAACGGARADDELDYGLEQVRLHRIELTGNETFSDDEVKGVLRLQERDWKRPLSVPSYRPDLIATQLRQLQGWYRQRGFHTMTAQLDSIGTDSEDRGDILYISVDEGPRTYIDRVVILGAAPLKEADLRKVLTLVEGRPAPAALSGFGEDVYRMRDLYWAAAHLQAQVTPSLQLAEVITGERRSAVITYHIEPGPAYTVRDIVIIGEHVTRDNIISREFRLAPGDPFSWKKAEATRQRLLQTALFRDVNLTAVDWDTTGHSAVLNVRVTERKPAFYELGIGFGSRERIRATLAWGHNNLWGTGRRVSLRLRPYWNVEEIIERKRTFKEGDLNYRADLLYSNPHLFSRDYPFELNIYAKRETRGESALIQNIAGFLVGTSRLDDRRWTNRLDFNFRIVDPHVHPLAPESVKEQFAAADVSATQTRSIIHSLFHEARDDLFNPANGHYFFSQLELAGGLLGGDNSFLKWSGSVQKYRPFLGGVLAGRVRVGAVRPYGDSRALGADGVPYDDRFFAGGAYSVRGYRHNSLGPQITDADEQDEVDWGTDAPLPDDPARGGNYQLITNVEWRFPLPLLSRWNFASVVFFDGGNVWENLSDIQIAGFRFRSFPGDPTDPSSTKIWDFRYSLGTGVRLNTPFGPFRLDIGFPLKRARYQNLDQILVDDEWRIHFSLGHVF